MKRVLFLQYTNPAAYPPLEHVSRILAKEDWRILFLGTSIRGVDSLQFPPNQAIEIRSMSFSHAGWRQKLHYLRFILWTLFWTLRWQPSLVYASDLPSCPGALLMSLFPGVRVIYHEHDSPAPSGGSVFQQLARSTRRMLARRAVFCILPNEKRASRFAKETANGHNVKIVWNCASLDEVPSRREPSDGEHVWVLYHGSIVPARLPTTVLSALALLPERVKLRVIGYETAGHIGYVNELRSLADQLGISNRIQIIGPVPRADLLQLEGDCDVGLAFMPKHSNDLNEQAMVGASNKPFDYLSSGLSLLVADIAEWRKLFVEGGYARVCDPDDPRSIADELLWFVDHPDEMRAMGERGRLRILSDWNYETQFAPILQRMKLNLDEHKVEQAALRV